MLYWIAGLIVLLVKMGIVLGVMLFLAAYLVWAERKLLARHVLRGLARRHHGLSQFVETLRRILLVHELKRVDGGAERL